MGRGARLALPALLAVGSAGMLPSVGRLTVVKQMLYSCSQRRKQRTARQHGVSASTDDDSGPRAQQKHSCICKDLKGLEQAVCDKPA